LKIKGKRGAKAQGKKAVSRRQYRQEKRKMKYEKRICACHCEEACKG
jgi:hypothetical protein